MTVDMPITVRSATSMMFARYLTVLEANKLEDGDETSAANLAWMCRTAIEGNMTLPLDKLSRWLGFVQGVMAVRGMISVEGERDFSRPLFHAAYAAEKLLIPPRLGRAEGFS